MSFKVPHTLVLLLLMMLAALIATWFVPQGFFETMQNSVGRTMVVPDTYQVAETQKFLNPWDFLTAIPRAFADAQSIMFFLLIVGGVMAIARKTGTVDAYIGRLLERFGHSPSKLIFAVIFFFALASGTIGTSGEYIPFVLILVAVCKAMRLDAMTAAGMTVTGYGIGYGVSAFNPYTVLVAQQIADIPVYSGSWLRFAIFIPFVLIGVHHVWSYSNKVIKTPSTSMMKDIPCPLDKEGEFKYPTLNIRHKLILLSFLCALGVAVWGISSYQWYLYELGAVFITWGIIITFLGGLNTDDAANQFMKGASELVFVAILVGVARGISLILEDGQVLHTFVYYMSLPLSYLSAELSAVGMLVFQTILNLFIPSGSGQAYVTMPLMAPLSDLLGIPRQVAILAFQFGDGFSNMIIPTNGILMGIIGVAGVPYTHWFRFCLPLLLKLMAAASFVLVLATMYGYGAGM